MTTIRCDIVSAEAEIFRGEATLVVATGEMGELGIAPRHAPLITRLKPGKVVITQANGEKLDFAISGGLLSMSYGMPGLVIGCFGSAVLLAVLTGLLNNLLRIPSLVLTMGLTMIYEIIGAKLAGNYGYVRLDNAYTAPGSAPLIIVFFLLSAAVFYFIYNN